MTSLAPARDTTRDELLIAEQMQPVGPHPDGATLFVGALLWASPDGVSSLMRLVRDDDIESPPLSIVLAAIRRMPGPYGPQLVEAELLRAGELSPVVAMELRDAVIAGASPAAARQYAAAVVAAAFRRRVESFGHALAEAAAAAAESEVIALVTNCATQLASTASRLTELRGDH